MGQYWVAYDLETKEYRWPKHDGYKLVEHAYWGSEDVDEVMRLLKDHWSRVVWLGDYHDRFDELMEHGHEFQSTTLCPAPRYLINLSRGVYYDLEKYGKHAEMLKDFKLDVYHPLPILTAASNGRGGGDFYGLSVAKAGIWAGDRLKASDFEDDVRDLKETDWMFVEYLFVRNTEVLEEIAKSKEWFKTFRYKDVDSLIKLVLESKEVIV